MFVTVIRFVSKSSDVAPMSFETEEQVKKWLGYQYSSPYSFGIDNLLKSGRYRLLGWEFDFRPYLKKYVYLQYDHWQAAYAPNKSYLHLAVSGPVHEIVERK